MSKEKASDIFTRIIIKQKNEIIAGNYSCIDNLYEEKYWNIDDIAWVLATHQLARDEEADVNIYRKYTSAHNHYFSILKEGINNGNLSIISEMDLERIPSKPKFLSTFSLRYNLNQYARYISRKLDLLNSDVKLLTQFVLPDDVLAYAKEIGLDFPDKFMQKRSKLEQTNRGSHVRWDEQRKPLVDKATEFMLNLIQIGCLCNHEKLTNITFELAKDESGVLLKDLEQKGMGLKRAIKRSAKSIVPAQRRFGTVEYNSTSCKCPITDHQNFKLPRHRE